MSGNTFGLLYCVTSFGESHGPAYGGVVDGCPPGLGLNEEDIQKELNRRKPGASRHVTQRQESDRIEILSGVFEAGPRARRSVSSSGTRTSAARTTARSPTPSARVTRLHVLAEVRPARLPRRRPGFRARDRDPRRRRRDREKWLRERYGVEVRGHLAQLGPNRSHSDPGMPSTGIPFFLRTRRSCLCSSSSWTICAPRVIPAARG